MKQICIYTVLACCLILCASFETNPIRMPFDGLPVVDLTEEYPEKEFFVSEDNINYVILETTPEALTGERFMLTYVSDSRIVGYNWERRDVLIFDGDGKMVSSFNHTIPSDYDRNNSTISSLVYDESRKEVFVVDNANKACLVYSEDGKVVRRLKFTDDYWNSSNKLYNFDERALLSYSGYRPRLSTDEIDELYQKTPYVFLSKEDGSAVSNVSISLPERIPENMHYLGGGSINTNNIFKGGQDFVIADRSSDTIYLLTHDKKLSPLFVRTPSVFDSTMIVYISVNFKTDRYLFFGISSYDFTKKEERLAEGQLYGHIFSTRNMIYDLHTGEVFTANRPPRFNSFVETPENTGASPWFSAARLIDRLENGSLDSEKLKQAAQIIKDGQKEIYSVVGISKIVVSD